MADGQKFATLDDLAAVTGLAAPVYTVGPAASGAVYTTVQEAVTQAKTDIDAATITSALVLVYPGTYLQDVSSLCSAIYLAGLGGPADVIIRSLTVSDASAASITAFNASGTFTDLVNGAYTTPAVSGGVENLTLFRDAAATAYGNVAAEGSLRLLGFDVANGTFLNTKFIVSNCRILKATNAAAGQGGIHGCYGNQLEVDGGLITGGCLFEQYAVKQFYGVQIIGTGVLDDTYNSAGTIPVTPYAATLLYDCHIAGEIELNGDVADFASRNCYIGSIDNNCTAAGSASTVEGGQIAGAVDNADVDATITITGTEMTTEVTGAGKASVTVTSRKMAAGIVPLTDNTHGIGSSTMRVAAVHATSFAARADAADTAKATLSSTGIAMKGADFSVTQTAAAAEAVGKNSTINSGVGGAAGAGAGAAGGIAALDAAAGGAGTSALAAGNGGVARIRGGDAGAANTGNGGNGGNVTLAGGALSGGGTAGKVISQSVLEVTAPIQCTSAAKSANFAFDGTFRTARVTTAAAAVTGTLPTAVGCDGRRYTMVKVDSGAGAATWGTTSSQTINGAAPGAMSSTQWGKETVESDGAHWIKVA